MPGGLRRNWPDRSWNMVIPNKTDKEGNGKMKRILLIILNILVMALCLPAYAMLGVAGGEMLQVMDYRRQIKGHKDKGNLVFARAAAEKRELTADERKEVDAVNAQIDTVDEEMAQFMRMNRISDEMLRTYNPNLPDPQRALEQTQKEKRAAFFNYMRHGLAGMTQEQRGILGEQRALVENTAGLYLIPEDLEAEIYRGLPQVNILRQLARIRQTTRDKVSKRSLTEVSVGWGKLETGSTITESTPTPSKDYIYAEDLYGLVKIGEDELMDGDDILAAIIADSLRVAIANEEAKQYVIGTGHSFSKPDGVTLDTTVISTYTDLDTADTMVPDDLLDLEYTLPGQYRNGASFLMASLTALQVRKVKATNGPYLWTPSPMVGQPQGFDGYPVYTSEDVIVPASGNVDRSIVGIFGNWKLGYMIVDRMGISIQRLNELYAEAGLVGFKVHFRVGGGVIRSDAFRALDNNT